jgi:pimeloyl-ACP methyl ester carboxylesterase
MNQSPKSTTHFITTEDGWKLALHRYPKKTRNRLPVLLVHGLASNRHNMDFPLKEKSLAKFLWKKGWDTWIVELRGAGASSKPKPWEWHAKRWNYDHYVRNDLPSVVDFILRETRKPQIHWIGHSMGGFLAFSFLKTRSAPALKSVVAAGSPLTIEINPGYFKWTSYLDGFLKLIPLLPYRTLGKLVSIYAKWLYEMELATLFVKENMDLKTLRLGARLAIDDVSADVFLQVHKWFREKKLLSMDGKTSYSVNPKKFTVPLLMITGSKDPFTSSPAVRQVFDRLASRKKKWVTFGRTQGHRSEYGHLDLIVGKHAPTEVFPLIAQWLEKHGSE